MSTRAWNIYYRQSVEQRDTKYRPTKVAVWRTDGRGNEVSKATVVVRELSDNRFEAATACLNPIDGHGRGRTAKETTKIGTAIASGRLDSEKYLNMYVEGDKDSGYRIVQVEGRVTTPPETSFDTLNDAILWNIGARRVTDFSALENIALI